MYYDSKTNQEKQVCPAGDCSEKNYLKTLFLSDAFRFVYTIGKDEKVFVTNIYGTENRHIANGFCSCVRKIGDKEWAYVKVSGSGEFWRFNVDNPSEKELVFNKIQLGGVNPDDVWICFFSVSGDGKWAHDVRDGHKSTLIDCINNTFKNPTGYQGSNICWTAMSPGNSHRFFFFEGNHSRVSMFASAANGWTNQLRIWVNDFYKDSSRVWVDLDNDGRAQWGEASPEMSNPKWSSNDVQYMTISGPGNLANCAMDEPTNKLKCDIIKQLNIHLGKFNSTFTAIEKWVRITNSENSNYYHDAFIDPPEQVSVPVAPIINPAGGAISGPTKVEITCVTPDAQIRYTTDGSTPNATSTLYTSAITISNPTTIKAIAVKNGMSSAVTVAEFILEKYPVVINPNGGVYIDSVKVTLSCATAGAKIYYTQDNTIPTTTSTLYSSPFFMKRSGFIQAVAKVGDVVGSVSKSERFTINPSEPIITVVSPNGGEHYAPGAKVLIRWNGIAERTSGVVIEFSTDKGKTWTYVVEDAIMGTDAMWDNYLWIVPQVTTDLAMIKIRDYYNGAVADVSDAPFKISPSGSFAVFDLVRDGLGQLGTIDVNKRVLKFSFSSSSLHPISVFVCDIDGKTVFKYCNKKPGEQFVVYSPKVRPGVYLVKITNKNNEYNYRIIVP